MKVPTSFHPRRTKVSSIDIARPRDLGRQTAAVRCAAILTLAACSEQGTLGGDTVLGTSAQALSSDSRNVAADPGVTVLAQSTFPGYAAERVIDGDTDATVGPEYGWANAHASAPDGRLPQWLEVDFGAPRLIDRVVLHTSQGFEIKDYDLHFWNGEAWSVLLSQSGNTEPVIVHEFPEIETSKLRVVGLRGPDAQTIYVRINELEIYGRDVETVSPVTVETAEEGEGWQRIRVSGPDGASGVPIAEDLTIIAPDGGLATAPLPQAIIQDLEREGSTDTHILADWVIDELTVAEAQGSLTPRLLEIAEPDDTVATRRSAGARLFGSCSNKEIQNTKSVSRNLGYHKEKTLGQGLTGEIEVSGAIVAVANMDVRMTQRRYAIFGKCIPYATSFKSAQINGQLAINKGARVEGNVEYTHHWQERIAEPHLGTVSFMVGPVPVWINISLPITVGLDLSAEVSAGVTYKASQAGQGAFTVSCTSSGCSGSSSWNLRGQPLSELVDADINGQVRVNPWVEGAVKTALYHENVLYVEAGLKPTLQAHVWGYLGSNCGDADQDGSNENVRALMGDLQGTIYLTAKLSALSKSPKVWSDLWHYTHHIGYSNLLRDWSAAQPMISGPAGTNVNADTFYGLRMRPCWPFPGTVDYEIEDGAGNMYSAEGATTTVTQVPVRWSSPGRFELSATALGDDRGRDFDATTTRRVDVRVGERNLARDPGVSVSAQSTFSGYAVQRVIDGSTSTALGGAHSWANAHTSAPNGRLPQWLAIDLGSGHQLERIRVYTTAGYPIRDYDIQAWDGSANWNTIGSARGNTAAVIEHDISVNASRLRIVSLRGPDRQTFHARLNEVEVYGY